MRTPLDHPINCKECGSQICAARIFDTAHQTWFVCSLSNGHVGSHFDKPQVARWFDPKRT